MSTRALHALLAAAFIHLVAIPPVYGDQKVPPPRQNVIIILVDDLRHDSLGHTGHPFMKTPAIDRLAREGLDFSRAFVTTSLCSPSRASLLTGKLMHRHGVIDNNVPMAKETTLFPELLQKQGYQTAMIGKWHMGGGSDAPRPGFDHWVSFKGQGFYTAPNKDWSLNINGKVVPQQGYITDELTDHALDWLNSIDRDRPFFLHLAHKAVHAPFEPAERHRSLYAQATIELPKLPADWKDRDGVPMWVKNQRNSWHGIDYPYHSAIDFADYYRTYCKTLQAVDDSVGRILDWVEKSPARDRTVILFLSDNGFLWGEHGLIDKRCAYEESIRIPLVAWGPGIIRKPRRVEAIVANIDLAPTILEMASVPVPSDLDGVSLLPLLKDENTPPLRTELFYEYFWEWNFPHTPTQFALRTDRFKFMEYHGIWDTDELFDLSRDPAEQNNLINDPAYRKQVQEMRKRLHELRTQTGGNSIPLGTKQGPGMNKRNSQGSPAADFPKSVLEDPS